MASTHYDLSRLSPREAEVLSLASKGLLDKEIARELGLSLNTLRTYWNRIRMKAGESSRTGLATAWVSEELRSQAQTESVPLDLDDSWWEFDAVNELVRASKTLSERVGLTGLEWHPFEEYNRLVHPDDLKNKLELVKQVAELHLPYVSFVERYLLPEGMIHCHTFGEIFFEDGKFVLGKGHQVVMQSLEQQPRLRLGRWICHPDSELIELDGDCNELFQLDCQQIWKLDDIRSRVALRDLDEFNKLFEPNTGQASNVQSRVFRVVTKGREPFFCRGVSRPGQNGVVVGSFSANF